MSRHLDPDQPVYWFWSKHHTDSGRLPSNASVEEIAAYYLKEIRRIQPSGPYLLSGFCVGGTIAYEIAQQLTHSGQEVALLALVDPLSPGRYSLYARLDYELSQIEQIEGVGNIISHIVIARGAAMIKQRLIQYLQKSKFLNFRTMERREGEQSTAPKQNHLYIHPLAAHAIKRYKPQPSNNTTVLFMPGMKRLLPKKSGHLKPPSHWAKLLRGNLETYYVPEARHEQLFREPVVQEIAKLLNKHLRDQQKKIKNYDTGG